MPNKLLIATLAATMMLVTAAQAPAAAKKKKPIKQETQTEESAGKDAMDDMALDIAAGMLGGALKKGQDAEGRQGTVQARAEGDEGFRQEEQGRWEQGIRQEEGSAQGAVRWR